MMTTRERQDLDRHITGNYGNDQDLEEDFEEQEMSAHEEDRRRLKGIAYGILIGTLMWIPIFVLLLYASNGSR